MISSRTTPCVAHPAPEPKIFIVMQLFHQDGENSLIQGLGGVGDYIMFFFHLANTLKHCSYRGGK